MGPMLFNYDGDTYQIKFRYGAPGRNRSTNCRIIRRGETVNDNREIVSVSVRTHSSDSFVKKIGRRIALKKAINELVKSCNPINHGELKCLALNAYFKNVSEKEVVEIGIKDKLPLVPTMKI